MISLIAGLVMLLLGYIFYGRFIEKLMGAEQSRPTPALEKPDGVDFVPLHPWRLFMIQFLNIAGLGPIFGPILGAMYGPAAFLWVVLGGIFAGAVHDYFSGMLSLRLSGGSISEVVGDQLGRPARQFMRVFSVVLLLLVGVVFTLGPAQLLAGLSGSSKTLWVVFIVIYYILATLLPIDKIIGRIYPFFGALLLFMALALLVMLFRHHASIPEITLSSLANQHISPEKYPLFPMLFITIACGALSGFHATQSPMAARCLIDERHGKAVFFGGMLSESVVGLIWAAAALTFFGGAAGLNAAMTAHGNNAGWLVNEVCNSWLGRFGGVLAILGVIVCPITSGDTAFRSARLTIADMLKLSQQPIRNRLLITIPLFIAVLFISNLRFDIVWRYFAWSNQMLATVVLWATAVWLVRHGKNFWPAAVPAGFMTAVGVCYILTAPEGFRLPWTLSFAAGIIATAVAAVTFMLWRTRQKPLSAPTEK